MKGTFLLLVTLSAFAVTTTLPVAEGDEPLLTPFLNSIHAFIQDVQEDCNNSDFEFLCSLIGFPESCIRYPPQPVCPSTTLPPKTIWPQYVDLIVESVPFVEAVDNLIGKFMDLLKTSGGLAKWIDTGNEECTSAILEYSCQWIHGQLASTGGCVSEDQIGKYLPCFDDCVAVIDNCLGPAKEQIASAIQSAADAIGIGTASINPMDIVSMGLNGETSCGFLGASECTDLKFDTRFKTDNTEPKSPWSFLLITFLIVLGILVLTALVALVLYTQRNAALAAYYDKEDDDMMTQKSGWTRGTASTAGSDGTSMGASTIGGSSTSGTTWGGSSRGTRGTNTSQVTGASRGTRSSRGTKSSRSGGSGRSKSSRGGSRGKRRTGDTHVMEETDMVSAVTLEEGTV